MLPGRQAGNGARCYGKLKKGVGLFRCFVALAFGFVVFFWWGNVTMRAAEKINGIRK